MVGSTACDDLDEEEEEGQQQPKTQQHPQVINRRGGRLRNITAPFVQH